MIKDLLYPTKIKRRSSAIRKLMRFQSINYIKAVLSAQDLPCALWITDYLGPRHWPAISWSKVITSHKYCDPSDKSLQRLLYVRPPLITRQSRYTTCSFPWKPIIKITFGMMHLNFCYELIENSFSFKHRRVEIWCTWNFQGFYCF